MSEAATVRTPQKTREKLVVVDSDTHIDETEDTWAYVEPHERELAPVGAAPKQIDPSRPATRYWVIDGKRHLRFIRDDKRTEELKLRLTERELLDLSRLAAMDDRSVAEFVVRMLRASMYGSVATRLASLEGALRDGEGR